MEEPPKPRKEEEEEDRRYRTRDSLDSRYSDLEEEEYPGEKEDEPLLSRRSSRLEDTESARRRSSARERESLLEKEAPLQYQEM